MENEYKPLRLLIDADMVAYLACQHVLEDVSFDGDVHTQYVSLAAAKDEYETICNEAIEAALEAYKADKVKLYPCHCFSARHYFRSEVMPTYKAGRAQTHKPPGYRALEAWVTNTYRAIHWNELEADDVIGILATRYPNECLIISGDKDMKTIPCPQYDFLRQEFKNVSEEEATQNFLVQALAGDATDGYSGCPTFGDKTARKWFEKDGWNWSTVIKAYESKGLTENDALRNARCAYILHDKDYNRETGEVLLWTP